MQNNHLKNEGSAGSQALIPVHADTVSRFHDINGKSAMIADILGGGCPIVVLLEMVIHPADLRELLILEGEWSLGSIERITEYELIINSSKNSERPVKI